MYHFLNLIFPTLMIFKSPLQRIEMLPLYHHQVVLLPVKMNVLEAVETVSPNMIFFLFYAIQWDAII